MTSSDQQNKPRSQPNRLVFLGFFCLWAQPRLPPDVASVDLDGPANPDSGGDAVVVLDHPATAGHAADVAGLEASRDFLRSRMRTGISRQGTIPQGLMRTLGVEVVRVLSQSLAQAAVVQESTPADEFMLHRSDPTLGIGIAVGTVGWDLDRGDIRAGCPQDALPGLAELAIPVVDQVAAANLLQPAPVCGRLPGDLGHVGFVAVLGDTTDLNLPGRQVDAKEDIVGLRPVLALDLGGEEVGRHENVRVSADEGLPGGIGAARRSRCEPVALQDSGNGPGRDGQQEHGEDASDTLLTPDRVLRGQALDDLLDGNLDARTTSTNPLDAQLAGLAHALPALHGLGFGDGGDLGQALPTHGGACLSQPHAPSVGEAEPVIRAKLLMAQGQLGAQMHDFRKQLLVLPGREGGGHQPDQEGCGVHGAGKAAWRIHPGKIEYRETRRAA